MVYLVHALGRRAANAPRAVKYVRMPIESANHLSPVVDGAAAIRHSSVGARARRRTHVADVHPPRMLTPRLPELNPRRHAFRLAQLH